MSNGCRTRSVWQSGDGSRLHPILGVQKSLRGLPWLVLTVPLHPCRVGCVIVAADGKTVLGEGFHIRKGGPHAEAAALADAQQRGITFDQMSGATAYVTLEPCHRGPGKTTPPCDEALVASGLREVHIAILDPDPTFGNAGAEHLRKHGVRVTVGTGAEEVTGSLRPYLHHRRTGLPYVVLKVARCLIAESVVCEVGRVWRL